MNATDEGGQVDTHAIRARADAATQGPWRVHLDSRTNDSASVETAWSHDPDGGDTEVLVDLCTQADAEFIAHARTDIPKLLDENEQLRAENERLRNDETLVKSLAYTSTLLEMDARQVVELVRQIGASDSLMAAMDEERRGFVDTIAAVRALHEKTLMACDCCDPDWDTCPNAVALCTACQHPAPCPTIRLLDGADTGHGDQSTT